MTILVVCDVTILPNLTLQTDIWLVVSVPVLSEQITDVQPSVSTDGRLRTMAFFLAILLVPSARQVVMTAGRPGRKQDNNCDETASSREGWFSTCRAVSKVCDH